MNETPYRLATYAQSRSIVRAVTGDEPAIFAYRPVALVPSEEAFSFMTIEKDLGQQLTRLGHEAPHDHRQGAEHRTRPPSTCTTSRSAPTAAGCSSDRLTVLAMGTAATPVQGTLAPQGARVTDLHRASARKRRDWHACIPTERRFGHSPPGARGRREQGQFTEQVAGKSVGATTRPPS